MSHGTCSSGISCSYFFSVVIPSRWHLPHLFFSINPYWLFLGQFCQLHWTLLTDQILYWSDLTRIWHTTERLFTWDYNNFVSVKLKAGSCCKPHNTLPIVENIALLVLVGVKDCSHYEEIIKFLSILWLHRKEKQIFFLPVCNNQVIDGATVCCLGNSR